MENYSLLMGDSSVDEDGGGVDGEAFQGHFPVPAACRNRDSCPPDLGFAMAAAGRPPPKTTPARKHHPIEGIRARTTLGKSPRRASQICHHRLPGKGQFLNLLPPSSNQSGAGREHQEDSKGTASPFIKPRGFKLGESRKYDALRKPGSRIPAVDKVADLAKPPAETQEPITSSSAVPLVSGEGCDLAGLLTFDPESIEPAPSTACDEPRPSAVLRQFQRLKALLSSPIETLVEDPEEVKSVLEEIQHHLPVTLQVKLWPVVTLSVYRSRVKLARQRIDLRHAQLPLKADIADKCQRLNEKKAALDAKTDTSVSTAELETLRKELADLEEGSGQPNSLFMIKALIARSQKEERPQSSTEN
ncbi:hypothetical protein QYE76_001475 [Lolium multiflorum]|uniref:Uncharacterized protein n=1 Tax=Lolium multiflorum TaxID=4521 RepID=A0AAD8RLX8_LOLMU|nr:hypothetical protein QYE76_001475 [Lolium multiflorum]